VGRHTDHCKQGWWIKSTEQWSEATGGLGARIWRVLCFKLLPPLSKCAAP